MVRESITMDLYFSSTLNEPTGVWCLGLPIEAGICRMITPSMLTVKVCAEILRHAQHGGTGTETAPVSPGHHGDLRVGGPVMVGQRTATTVSLRHSNARSWTPARSPGWTFRGGPVGHRLG